MVSASALPTLFFFPSEVSWVGDRLPSLFPKHRVGEEHVLVREQNQRGRGSRVAKLRVKAGNGVRAERPGGLDSGVRPVIEWTNCLEPRLQLPQQRDRSEVQV